MKNIFILLSSFFASSFLFAQWEWQNPLPQGNTIFDMCFIDEMNGWAVGWNRTIIHTTDGGLTWIFQNSEKDDITEDKSAIRSVHFTDLQNGWAVGGWHSFMLTTKDGGKTWMEHEWSKDKKLPSFYLDVFFTDQNTGWFCASSIISGYIYNTLDGGMTWNEQFIGSEITALYFTSSSSGWAVGSYGKILHTEDGGESWVYQRHGTSEYFRDVFFYDDENGWVVGSDGSVLLTSNGGESWEHSTDPVLSGKSFYTVSFIDPYAGWTGGHNSEKPEYQSGVMLKTSDGGITWEEESVDPNLPDISCIVHTTEGVSFTSAGYEIFKTESSEEDWNRMSSGFNNCDFNNVFFTDDMKGWAVGRKSNENGSTAAIYHTSDGGVNWDSQEIPYTKWHGLKNVFFADDVHGWTYGVSSDSTRLFYTCDGGETWETQGVFASFTDLYFINPLVGWMVGWNGKIMKTENGGWDWVDQSYGADNNLESVVFIDENNGWISGGSVVLKTSNGGLLWEEQLSFQGSGIDICLVDHDHVWVINPGYGYENGVSYRTTDGGETWDEMNVGLQEACFTNELDGWGISTYIVPNGASYLYNIWHTKDGGTTWDIQKGLAIGGIFFTDDENGWAVGQNGTILHTNNGGTASAKEIENPDQLKEIIVFPCPSSKSTITFTLTNIHQNCQLTCFNLLGQEVHQEAISNYQDKSLVNVSTWLPGIYIAVLYEDGKAVGRAKFVVQ